MVNYCLSLLKEKIPDQKKKDQTKKIYAHLFSKVFSKTTEFEIKDKHIRETFRIIDKIYFAHNITYFINNSGSTISFKATSKLTKSAGCCDAKYYLDDKGNVEKGDFVINISKPIIDNIFKDTKTKSLKINGLQCYDRLECYINLYQHEILHLLITIFCTKDGMKMGGHTGTFRDLAYNLFGHTEYKHLLLQGDGVKFEEDTKFNKLNVEIGDIVESKPLKKGKILVGEVVNLTNKNVRIKLDNGKLYNIMYGFIDKINKSENKKTIKTCALTLDQIKNKVKIGDTIYVKLKGKLQQGIVLNLGKSRVSVKFDEGKKWYIPYDMIVIQHSQL